ncbi:MAG: hypothetical protein KH415_19530 [Clostridium sp.]|nr:hypothetical protein [Clostridium sp.]
MKFENFEVEEMYYELHKRYGVIHTNHGDEFDNKAFTYEDLITLEKFFREVDEIIKNE